jgi:hypothetical protein
MTCAGYCRFWVKFLAELIQRKTCTKKKLAQKRQVISYTHQIKIQSSS